MDLFKHCNYLFFIFYFINIIIYFFRTTGYGVCAVNSFQSLYYVGGTNEDMPVAF